MPIDYANYPPNWQQIRDSILTRASHRCEHCGLENGQRGHRDRQGNFWPFPSTPPPGGWTANTHIIQIILTIAHLDHDTTHNHPDNLAALCQRCHLRHDAQHHTRNAARTRRQRKLNAGQHELPLPDPQ